MAAILSNIQHMLWSELTILEVVEYMERCLMLDAVRLNASAGCVRTAECSLAPCSRTRQESVVSAAYIMFNNTKFWYLHLYQNNTKESILLHHVQQHENSDKYNLYQNNTKESIHLHHVQQHENSDIYTYTKTILRNQYSYIMFNNTKILISTLIPKQY